MRKLLVVALLSGCATQPEMVWFKPNTSAQEFNVDYNQCRAQAFSVPNALSNVYQVVAVQNSCMQGKGWYLIPKSQH